MIKEHDCVVLTSDLPSEGLLSGDVGTVVHIHRNVSAYEVEFATLVESEGLLASIISVRSELARGDLRALYVGWLLYVHSGELEPVDLSPPVPPGLAKLSGSLTSLVEFLRINRTLIRVAAEPAAKSRTVADLMQNLEAASRRQSRVIRRTLNI
jgi:hypothetical protein